MRGNKVVDTIVGIANPPDLMPAQSPLSELSAADLRRAAAIREEIDRLESDLADVLTGSAPAPAPRKKKAASKKKAGKKKAGKKKAGKKKGGKRRLSPEARERIADAARRRWAAKRAKQGR